MPLAEKSRLVLPYDSENSEDERSENWRTMSRQFNNLAVWNVIADVNLTSGQGIVSFPNIPSQFLGLQLRGIVRSSLVALTDTLGIRFNGDTNGNYDWTYLEATAPGAGSVQGTAQTAAQLGTIAGASSPATKASPIIIDVMNLGTTFHKNGLAQIGDINAGVNVRNSSGAFLWNNPIMITQIDLYNITGSTATFDIGTRVTLLGVGI